MKGKQNHIVLNTGTKMPIVGLGTWKSPPEKAAQAVEYALMKAGYRHIDCAAVYGNEKEIGQSFERVFSGATVKREDIFITSKLWNTKHAKGDVVAACKQTLADLQIEYLDLYLMHWGIARPDEESAESDAHGLLMTDSVSVAQTWEAMQELVSAGLVRAIGVANFTGAMLVDLCSYARVRPAVNQIELHPYNQQARLVEFCQRNNIAVTAYSPLGSPGNMKARGGEPILSEDKNVLAIATAHGKSSAQILIRWAIQRGTVVIPKSVTPERIAENIAVLNFELSPPEIELLGTLDRKHRFVDPYDWWRIPYFD